MLDLLIAILMALGVYVSPGSTEEQIKREHETEYNQAVTIIETGTYRTEDGGVVIVETTTE